ncbi:matrixin family metalloprotease [Nocardioides sp. Kera G14]|uniref:matrixin family metalloprotease n=1 Tax=Nocardioides sp. Kera G14 TaxID=2884264 RepID=UPI001D13036C|nr:matrixin family metalloprotease [Nocardioides sp. Kera G14]UDY24667.1 matrixin family metalloprotease [Nocardioides sp. Kera G14]
MNRFPRLASGALAAAALVATVVPATAQSAAAADAAGAAPAAGSTSASSGVTLPPTSVSVSLRGGRMVGLNSRLVIGGQVKAPAGGVLSALDRMLSGATTTVSSLLAGASSVTELPAPTPVSAARVSLQLKTPTGWSSIATVPTTASGTYAVAVPTGFYGTHTWRVLSAATGTSTEQATSPFTVGVRVPYAARGSARSYARLSSGDVRWNPCAPIPFYVNRAGMPKNALPTIMAAMQKVHEASGLTFRFSGYSNGVPFAGGNSSRSGMPNYGFTIAWAKPQQAGELRGTVLAVSGSWSRSTQVGSSRRAEYFSGGMVIDRTEKLKSRMGKGKTLGYVVMHEMGHVLGLGHTADASQMMAPTVTARSYTQYGAGDLAGFAAVGLAGGCL